MTTMTPEELARGLELLRKHEAAVSIDDDAWLDWEEWAIANAASLLAAASREERMREAINAISDAQEDCECASGTQLLVAEHMRTEAIRAARRALAGDE